MNLNKQFYYSILYIIYLFFNFVAYYDQKKISPATRRLYSGRIHF